MGFRQTHQKSSSRRRLTSRLLQKRTLKMSSQSAPSQDEEERMLEKGAKESHVEPELKDIEGAPPVDLHLYTHLPQLQGLFFQCVRSHQTPPAYWKIHTGGGGTDVRRPSVWRPSVYTDVRRPRKERWRCPLRDINRQRRNRIKRHRRSTACGFCENIPRLVSAPTSSTPPPPPSTPLVMIFHRHTSPNNTNPHIHSLLKSQT